MKFQNRIQIPWPVLTLVISNKRQICDTFITNTTHHIYPWEAASSSATQPSLCNQKDHYRIHKSMSLYPPWGQINPFQALPSYFFNIHFNIISISRPGSSDSFSSFIFPHPKPIRMSLLPQTCYMPDQRILLDLITRINIWRGVQITKLLTVQSSLFSYLICPWLCRTEFQPVIKYCCRT